jgi:hypothetical protein
MSFVTLKTRPLNARGGTYLQKGVDTLVATFPRSRSTAIAQGGVRVGIGKTECAERKWAR